MTQPYQRPREDVLSVAYLEQTIDRTVKTAVQSAAVFIGGGTGIAGIGLGATASAVGVACIITLLMSLSSDRLYEHSGFMPDVTQRAVRTFAATLGGILAGTATFAEIEWGAAVSLAGSAAVLSILTSLGSKNIGIPHTASLLQGAEVAVQRHLQQHMRR